MRWRGWAVIAHIHKRGGGTIDGASNPPGGPPACPALLYTARPPARRLQAHLFLHLSPSEVRQQAVPLEFMHWYPMEARFKLMHRSLPPLHLSTQSV